MKHYELLTILPGTLVEDEVQPIIDEVHKIIQEAGAEHVTVEDKGKNKLAYPMKHIRYGYFHITQFAADPEKIQGMQERLALITQLLRTVITNFDPKEREHDAKHKKGQSTWTTLTEINKDDHKRHRAAQEGEQKQPEVPEAPAPKNEEAKAKSDAEKEKDKVKLEDIGDKLDEILDSDLSKV